VAIADSVFKQTVLNVSAQQLQQHTIESVSKWYNCLINELVKQIILYRRQNNLLSQHCVGQLLRVSLIVFQPRVSISQDYWGEHLGDGSPPAGSRGGAPVGVWGTKSPRSLSFFVKLHIIFALKYNKEQLLLLLDNINLAAKYTFKNIFFTFKLQALKYNKLEMRGKA